MEYTDAKKEFVKKWGAFAVNWGTSKTLGQIHGLLLISTDALCADDIMKLLEISRGSANMNLRTLLDWELVYKKHVTENRKEFFEAEKDIWKVFCKIVNQRKKKELDPMIEVLNKWRMVEGTCEQSKEFCKIVSDLEHFSKKADAALANIIKDNPSFIVSTYLKMI